ncbi:unnamed protein product [Mycena citricolor]|uniref:Uncharacterized protein n=1 Tax=Mycena citricolor TaxID=2018698 RepID=A0AAD2H5U8_9AGAR|nr:unnamed protein product [Mycena citricolor]
MSIRRRNYSQATPKPASRKPSPVSQIQTPTAATSHHKPLSQAAWIWTTEASGGNAPPGTRAFLRTYTAPPGQLIASATAIIAADNEYTLYANEFPVGSGSSSSTAQTWSINLGAAPQVVFAVVATNTLTAPLDAAGVIFAAEINFVKTAGNCTGGAYLVSDVSWLWPGDASLPSGFEFPGYNSSSWTAVTMEGGPAPLPGAQSLYLPRRAPSGPFKSRSCRFGTNL